MPTKKNYIKKSVSPKSIFDDMSNVVDSTITFNQGDLLIFNSSTHLLNPISTLGVSETGANFVGISRVSITSGKPISPIQGTDVDAAAGTPAMAGPEYGVTAMVVLKTGDQIYPGDQVYPNGSAGARHVTITVGSKKPIGIYQGPHITSAASGQEIEILLGAEYPDQSIKF